MPRRFAQGVCTLPLLALAIASQLRSSAGSSECANPFLDDGHEEVSLSKASSLLQTQRDSSKKQEQHRKTRSSSHLSTASCKCQANSPDWKLPGPRMPRCIFIDLGAANGNTFDRFLNDGYGAVKNCPSGGAYYAFLVEANPLFNSALGNLQSNYSVLESNSVISLASTAAYMCDGSTEFYLDTVDEKENYWGSSLSPKARDVIRSGQKPVTVPLKNILRLIVETALPEDYVMLKMDIEGSEHDIVPCLAQSPAADLVDALYVEQHPVDWSLAGAAPGALQESLAKLRERGMVIPEYDTPS